VSSSVNPVDVQIRSGIILKRWGYTVKYPKASISGHGVLCAFLWGRSAPQDSRFQGHSGLSDGAMVG
jgi:hypothetical protein